MMGREKSPRRYWIDGERSGWPVYDLGKCPSWVGNQGRSGLAFSTSTSLPAARPFSVNSYV